MTDPSPLEDELTRKEEVIQHQRDTIRALRKKLRKAHKSANRAYLCAKTEREEKKKVQRVVAIREGEVERNKNSGAYWRQQYAELEEQEPSLVGA